MSRSELCAWLRGNSVGFKETDTYEALLEMMVETEAELAEEARAMAEYEQSAANRGQPTVISSYGGGRGREVSVLDEARAGEEEARREMMAAAAAAAAGPSAIVSGVAVVGDVGGEDETKGSAEQVPVVVVEAVPLPAASALTASDPRRPPGGLPALANMLG